jgi:hypothetical protein
MSSSFKDFKLKAFRRSKDVEMTNTLQEQQTPTSEKIKLGAKAKKMAARFVPAALGTLSHPDRSYVHKVMGCVEGCDWGAACGPSCYA